MVQDWDWPDIGEQVRRLRRTAGLSQEALGERVDLDRTMIAKIERGSRRIDALELTKFARALGVPLHRLLTPPPPVLSRRGAALVDEASASGRATDRLDGALQDWLADVRQAHAWGGWRLAPLHRYPHPVAAEDDARAAARWLRGRLDLGTGPIDSLMAVCERAGQQVLVVDLPGDGASLVDGDLAVGVVSAAGDPGRRRATGAHELGHLVIGDEYSSDPGVNASRDRREAIIDAFAAELLLPVEALGADATRTRGGLIAVAATYRVSWSLALNQARRTGLADATQRRWAQPAPSRAEFLDAVGWAPQPDLAAIRVPPGYAATVLRALHDARISRVRAAEMLHGEVGLDDLPDDGTLDPAP
ncbi:hypothetical protein GCM10010123_25490 [Pilimelia anulata]|uniref:HTH cro/C1-type domain-containing protein n=1 Tax=Pilimelia anulata TaxID=53371 RepID=A0A8J3B4V5_9ACTN|nr:XRE family transcriptional regulator [Pilimelia anulata]GGJ94538.1 hypothetical protein GCM10010123_25490 [Pilimelia anulata]